MDGSFQQGSPSTHAQMAHVPLEFAADMTYDSSIFTHNDPTSTMQPTRSSFSSSTGQHHSRAIMMAQPGHHPVGSCTEHEVSEWEQGQRPSSGAGSMGCPSTDNGTSFGHVVPSTNTSGNPMTNQFTGPFTYAPMSSSASSSSASSSPSNASPAFAQNVAIVLTGYQADGQPVYEYRPHLVEYHQPPAFSVSPSMPTQGPMSFPYCQWTTASYSHPVPVAVHSPQVPGMYAAMPHSFSDYNVMQRIQPMPLYNSSRMEPYSVARAPAARKRRLTNDPEQKSAPPVPAYVTAVKPTEELKLKYQSRAQGDRENICGRPTKSYATLVGEELLSTPPPHCLKTAEIFQRILERYPFFTLEPRLLYSGIRHVVTKSPAFVKFNRSYGDQSGQARLWTIAPGHIHTFANPHAPVAAAAAPRPTSSQGGAASETESQGSFTTDSHASRMSVESERPETPDMPVGTLDLDCTPQNTKSTPLATASSKTTTARPDLAPLVTSHITFPSLATMSSPALSPGGSLPFSTGLEGMESLQTAVESLETPRLSLGFDRSSECAIVSDSECHNDPSLTSSSVSRPAVRPPLMPRAVSAPSVNTLIGFAPSNASMDFSGVAPKEPSVMTSGIGAMRLGRRGQQTLTSGHHHHHHHHHTKQTNATASSTYRRPVPMRGVSAFNKNNNNTSHHVCPAATPTLAVSNATVSSLASAMDFSLVKSRGQ